MKQCLNWLEKHGQWKVVLVAILIVAVFAFLGFRSSGRGVSIAVETDEFVIRGPMEYEARFCKEDIVSVDIAESFEFGNPIEEVSEGKYLMGTWSNGDYDEYYLIVNTSRGVNPLAFKTFWALLRPKSAGRKCCKIHRVHRLIFRCGSRCGSVGQLKNK